VDPLVFSGFTKEQYSRRYEAMNYCLNIPREIRESCFRISGIYSRRIERPKNDIIKPDSLLLSYTTLDT